MSLAPKRILVTRSRHQASTLADQLQALGAEPILIPTIALAPPTTYVPLDDALASLNTFDWLLFTSANAVEAFHQRLSLSQEAEPAPNLAYTPTPLRGSPIAAKVGGAPPASTAHPMPPPAVLSLTPVPSTLPRIAAIGPATAHALTQINLAPNLIPPQAVAESLAQALLTHITPGHTRILLIRAETARDTLPEALHAAGADVTIAPAYRNLIPENSIPLLQALFRSPSTWPDAITFTSSSTATNLLALLEAASLTLPSDSLDSPDPSGTLDSLNSPATSTRAASKTILRASIGPITSRTLRDLGYPPHLEAPTATIPSLVQTLAEHLHLKPR